MSKEAMKLALEAYLCREMPAGTIIGDPKWWVPKIAMAIREALAEQPAQEPVAWASLIGQYAHIVWGKQRPDDEIHTIPLYTSPTAQRKPWVGLTVCERTECFNSAEWNDLTQYAEVIEAKLKEKNQ